MQYEIIRSNRKSIAIQVKTGGEVVVRCPRRMPVWQIRAFVQSKADWIAKHIDTEVTAEPQLTEAELKTLRERTRTLVTEKVCCFAPIVGVSYGRIAIRAQHTRWGSCSSKGNLNFNCLLGLAPEEVVDYVVVHELCHRKHMNHSPQFWAAVEAVLPDYKHHKKWLKDNGPKLMARLPGAESKL